MTDDKIKNAVAEAKRFLRRVKEYDEAPQTEKFWNHSKQGYVEYKKSRNKQSGALRRSSLDLTGALADMRQS